MTDRIRHLTVVLDGDYRTDDVEVIVKTIQMIRGVAAVEQHVVSAQDQIARMSVRAEIEHDLHDAIDGVFRRKNIQRMVAEQKDDR
jgi:hypothetical protein